jgi:hypothetical protein
VSHDFIQQLTKLTHNPVLKCPEVVSAGNVHGVVKLVVVAESVIRAQ